MNVVEIMPDFFFIERGYLNGNHFVYRSENPVLIDTGYLSGFKETEESLTGLGVDLSRVARIINTHSHCDHVGGNRIIRERSGCEVFMHRVGKYFCDTRDDWATWWRYYCQQADFFDCENALEDGDVLAIGPYEFDVIYTPGHASDALVLYNREKRVLISSDTLWEKDGPVVTVRVEGSAAVFSWLESIERIKSLDVAAVYPGHGRPFTDFKGAVSRAERRLKGFLDKPKRIGNDLLKKIIVYTLMMKGSTEESSFFGYLMTTPWYRETVDLYFGSSYERKYSKILEDFLSRGIVKRQNGLLFTTVKP